MLLKPNTLCKEELLNALKAAGDDTRLRLLVLLSKCEHNVKDLTHILNQSQPRLSRHLKLLSEAKLIERFQEGSWVYYRLAREGTSAVLVHNILKSADLSDKQFKADQTQAEKVKTQRANEAQSYFKTHAKDWDQIRSLYIKEETVEAEMLKLIGSSPIEMLLDLGTGTGRILELFSNQFKNGIGVDINQEMLRHARARLDRLNLSSCELRHGDINKLEFKDGIADTIIVHQIMHFLEEPKQLCKEAARLLAPGGRLLIVDFAPHKQEQLRTEFAHQRLGFQEDQLWGWLKTAGLKALNFKLLPNINMNTNNKKSDTKIKDKDTLSVSLWLAGK